MHKETTVVVLGARSPSSTSKCSDDQSPSSSASAERQVARHDRKSGYKRRTYAPKTRTGCITCKIRRVKCDENKPHCRRCTSTGRRCDGFALPGESTKPKPSEFVPRALTNDVTSDALEQRVFSFFRSRTVPCVSSYFRDVVWDRLVLQLSHSEPAVRHAVNALGALHEERSLKSVAVKEGVDVALVKTSFPLVQYSKALNEMQSLLKSSSVSLDAVLVCSLVCIHFEALRESFVPALMHVENAIQMLHSKSKLFDARKVNLALVRAIMRMDLQGSLYLGSRVPGLAHYTAATDSILPSSINDLSQARDVVDTWTCRLLQFTRTVADDYKFKEPGWVPIEAIAKAQEFEQVFVTLDELLWSFMHKPTLRLSTLESHGLSMLRSRVKINRILAPTCLHSESSMYDRYMSDFSDILTICLHIIGSDNGERRLFSVSLDEGLIQPLFFLSTHCRDGTIRHRALEELQKLPSQDGIWHVETTKRTAEMCIRFEEALCDKEVPSCEDIPEWRRIHCAKFDGWDYEPKRKVKVHLRTRPNGMDGEWQDFEGEYDWCVRGKSFEDSFRILMTAELQNAARSPLGLADYCYP